MDVYPNGRGGKLKPCPSGGSNPLTSTNAPVIQWLECQPSKLDIRVRFPFGVPFRLLGSIGNRVCLRGKWRKLRGGSSPLEATSFRGITQLVLEYLSDTQEVDGSSPSTSTTFGRVGQPAESTVSDAVRWWFESTHAHQFLCRIVQM